MKFVRTLYLSPPPGSASDVDLVTSYEMYDQPVKDRAIYLAYLAWWTAAWRVKPLSWFIDNVVDPMLLRHHRRTCDNDCGKLTWTVTGASESTCTRMPLSAVMDCKLYDLDNRNSTRL